MYQSSPPPLPFPGEAAQAPVYPYAYHQQPQPYASTSSQPYPYYAPAQAAYDPYAVPATPQYQYQQPGSARPLPQPGNRPLPQPSSARALPQPPTKQRSLPTVPQRYSPAVDPRYQYTNQPSQALNQAPIIDSSSRPASYGAAVASLNHSPSIPQHHAGPGPPIPPPRQEPTRTESAPIPPIRHDSVTSIRNDTPAQSNGSPALSGAGSEFGSQTDSPVQSISSRTASIRSVDSFGGVKGTDSLGRRKQWTSWDRGASRKPVLENDIADLKLQDGPQTESQAVPIAPKRQESAPARYGAPIANAATPSKPDMPSFSINEESSSTATIPSFTVSEEPNKPDIPTFSISVEESAKHDIPIFSISEDKPDLPTFSISEESKPDVPTFSFSADDDPPPTGPSISFSVAPPTPKEQSTSEYFPKVLDPSPSTQATPSPAQPTVPAQPTTTSLSNDMLCGGCNLPIAGKVVSAMKRRWHPDCFTCTHCATSLEHVAFYEHDGRPYCHFDYHEVRQLLCYSFNEADENIV